MNAVWCFDMGNTRLKWRAPDGQEEALPHACLADLPAHVQGEVALLASVGPAGVDTALRTLLATRFKRIHLARTQARCGWLHIAYPVPAQLGVDRFLALLAVCDDRQDCLLASIGTATTLDLLRADGRHIGGLIAPSPTLMREALHARAPVLAATGGQVLPFAVNTVDALASGCTRATTALIGHTLQQATEYLGRAPQLVLHGGGAQAVASVLGLEHQLHAGLVLAGLARWGSHAGIA